MRLLKRDELGNFSLTLDLLPDNIPPYAILSHTWGPDEILFADLAKPPSDWQHKAGFRKIEFCADQARRHNLQFFWVDTCCIDKSSSAELQTAITSMFRWYRDAKQCHVYLSDVSSMTEWDDAFRQSRWFTRGWTLQELIAPKKVDFYSKEGVWLGDKQSLEPIIRDITGIPASTLRGSPLVNFTVSERKAWVRNRQTAVEEDMAYSLLGIFEVHIPLIDGEGRESAQRRLWEEVQRTTQGAPANDFSVAFSLSEVPEIQHFIARENEMTDIRRVLSSDGTRRVVVLHGLGGIGKTQLAVAYIKRYRDEHSGIFWFNVKDELSLQQSFTKVARQILQQHPHASCLSSQDLQDNYDKVVEAVKAWFSLPGNTRWLIVYDNYDNPRLTDRTNDTGINISHSLPTAHQGSIIITTRSSQIKIGHPIRIRKLDSAEDSLKILSSTSGRDSLAVDKDAKKLVEKLDGLPLALATAGTYLRRVAMTLANYLRYYEESWARLHTSTPSLGSYEDRTLCSTWQVSYEQVQKQNPLAAHLLRWWAYFSNEDIWFELIQPESRYGPAWIYDLADELNFHSAMGTLHDYGFVETDTFSQDLIESRGYSIHGCLHAWAMCILNQERDNCLGKLAVECIASRVSSQSDDRFWLLQRRLLPHAMTSYVTIQDSIEDLDWAFHNLGGLYTDQGKLPEAEAMYLRVLRGKQKAWGPDHTSTLDTVNNLGILYARQGKLQEAEAMFLRALQGKEKAWGPDHTSTLDTVHNLGNLYKSQGKLQKAEAMYLRALRGYEKARGPDHTSTLDTVNNLGNLYADQDKLPEAKAMYLRALRGYEKAWGPDHTSTLDTVNNLGNLYVDQDKLPKAEAMYLRALQGKEKAWGPDHTSTLDTVHNLGNLCKSQGKLPEAEAMYLRALRGKEKAWGPDHASILNTVNNLGLVYADQGKLPEAEAMYLRALRGKEKAWGPDHTSTLATVNNLGILYARQGKLQAAEAMYLRALRVYEKALGPQNITRHRPAINTMLHLGSLLQNQGRFVEARTYNQRAYCDLEGLLGSSHKDVQSIKSALLDLDRVIDLAGFVGGETPAPASTQTRKTRCRDVCKRVLGVRSK